MLHKSKALWRGIRRHGPGWQAEVRVTGHPRLVRQFTLDADPREMQKWRRDEKTRLQNLSPRATAGTFAADAKRYLDIVQRMPSIKMRRRDIALWVEVFGTRPRSSITRGEIRRQRDEWHERGPKRVWRKHSDGRRGGAWIEIEAPLAASTVNHRLRALANLFTELDGRHAPNPAREVDELDEDAGDAFGQPYDLIEAIIDAMPDRGRAAKGETRPEISFTKLRARALAYVGVSPSELMRVLREPSSRINLDEGWINTGRRRKGKGVATGRRPLTPEGVAALRALLEAQAPTQFSTSAMRTSIRRACRTVAAQIESRPGGKTVAAALRTFRGATDLRHSYVTEVLEKSGDFHATQLLVGHADLRTTLRYGKKVVNPALVAALAKVRAAGGFAAPGNRASAATDSSVTTSE